MHVKISRPQGFFNIPAIIAYFMLGGKILYVRDAYKGEKGRFGIPRSDIIFVYEL